MSKDKLAEFFTDAKNDGLEVGCEVIAGYRVLQAELDAQTRAPELSGHFRPDEFVRTLLGGVRLRSRKAASNR